MSINKSELLIQTKFIRFLAKYFRENFQGEDEKELDSFEYALEAYEDIVNSLDSRTKNKAFEYLTGLKTYEEIFELFDASWIDECVDTFESR